MVLEMSEKSSEHSKDKCCHVEAKAMKNFHLAVPLVSQHHAA